MSKSIVDKLSAGVEVDIMVFLDTRLLALTPPTPGLYPLALHLVVEAVHATGTYD
jgi:hypothetical protein